MSFYWCYAVFSNCHIKPCISAANIFPKWIREIMTGTKMTRIKMKMWFKLLKEPHMFRWKSWWIILSLLSGQIEIKCCIIFMDTRVKCLLVTLKWICIYSLSCFSLHSYVVGVLSTQPSADAEVTALMDKCCNLFGFDD